MNYELLNEKVILVHDETPERANDLVYVYANIKVGEEM